MSEQRFGWNYFENEVVIGDRQDKRRMIVLVFSEFFDIPKNKEALDEIVSRLNEQQATIENLRKWLIAEQKQAEKRDDFIKQKGLFREFSEKMAQNYERD